MDYQYAHLSYPEFEKTWSQTSTVQSVLISNSVRRKPNLSANIINNSLQRYGVPGYRLGGDHHPAGSHWPRKQLIIPKALI